LCLCLPSRCCPPSSCSADSGICGDGVCGRRAPAAPAYFQLFEIGCCEQSYSVRLAAAQEIGAGGDDALAELKETLTPPEPGHPAEVAGNGQPLRQSKQKRQNKQSKQGKQEAGEGGSAESAEEIRRRDIMQAWLAPLLVGSAATRRPQAVAVLRQLLDSVYEQNRRPDQEHADLSVEIALAQGFKYAANRRREHPQARDAARSYLTQQAREMLGACSFWFTRLTLVQALTLWHLPEGPDRREGAVIHQRAGESWHD
jgi:hypothetical protein